MIKNHLLEGVPFARSPNVGAKLDPTHLVFHYTAGASGLNTVQHFGNVDSKVSAHLVLDKAGPVWQCVPFNKVAWHAGKSEWEGIVGLNKCAIGLEFDNCGWLVRKEGAWYSPATHKFYPDSEVIEAKHKNGGPIRGWKVYPEVQIVRGLEIVSDLLKTYPKIRTFLGHEDIAPTRKLDPGPAFPLERFRALLR